MIVPIGAWCRTAYQVNEFLKVYKIKPLSFPYDWTITPFFSLRLTLDENFNPSDILKIENLELNKVGSITDKRTELIHHHDFSPPKMNELFQAGGQDENGIPKVFYSTDMISKAVCRFVHAYRNIVSLQRSSDKKILFIRWQRLGHPDKQFPHVFEGEDINSLAGVIKGFLSHDNFSILTVKSRITNEELPENPIIDYSREKYGVSATIIERKGYNGDGTNNFKGDTVSWHKLLDKFVGDEEVNLADNHMRSYSKKRRSFLARFFAAGDMKR